jgi:hypothetical protein
LVYLDIIRRWHQLFKGTLLTQKYARGDELIEPLQMMVEQTAEVYRQRLTKKKKKKRGQKYQKRKWLGGKVGFFYFRSKHTQ